MVGGWWLVVGVVGRMKREGSFFLNVSVSKKVVLLARRMYNVRSAM